MIISDSESTNGKRRAYKVVQEGCEVVIRDGHMIRYYVFSDPYTAAIFVRMVGNRRSN